MKKALASDIDGTLYFQDHFREGDLEAIIKHQSEGNLFGLCTGRAIVKTINIFEDKIQPDFYIATSGAVILNKNHQIIYEEIIALKDVHQIYQEYVDKAIIYVQTDHQVYKNVAEEYDDNIVIINSLEQVKDRKIYGLSLVFNSDSQVKEICQKINQKYIHLEGFQNKDSIDIVKNGCSKGKGILKVKELLHIDEITGIGDSYNDIPMLNLADISFTFHNSPHDIKQQVNHVVDSVEEAIGVLSRSVD